MNIEFDMGDSAQPGENSDERRGVRRSEEPVVSDAGHQSDDAEHGDLQKHARSSASGWSREGQM